jgi:hypothetical protein
MTHKLVQKPNIDPLLWGPYVWSLIHTLALKNDIYGFNIFLNCLKNVIPCSECREHFVRLLSVTPYDPNIYQDVYHYSYILHSLVNTRLKKINPTLQAAFNKTREDLISGEFRVKMWKSLLSFTTVAKSPADYTSIKCIVDSIIKLSPDIHLNECLLKSNMPLNYFGYLNPWVCENLKNTTGIVIPDTYYIDALPECHNCGK